MQSFPGHAPLSLQVCICAMPPLSEKVYPRPDLGNAVSTMAQPQIWCLESAVKKIAVALQ